MTQNAFTGTLTLQLRGQVEAFLIDTESSGRSPATLRIYRCALESFCEWAEEQGYKGLDSLSPAALRQYTLDLRRRQHRGRPLAPRTIQYYVRMVRIFASWLVREELYDRSPVERVKPPQVPQTQPVPLTDEEVRALVGACRLDRTMLGVRDAALITTLLDSGLRVSEVVQMRRDRIDASWAVTLVGKGSRQRTVQLGKSARRAIMRYMRTLDDHHSEHLWIGQSGPLTAIGVRSMLRKRSREAGIRNVNPHLLRHTFGANWIRSGGDLISLMRLMGHSSVAITQRYVLLGESDLAAAHARHSPADRLKL